MYSLAPANIVVQSYLIFYSVPRIVNAARLLYKGPNLSHSHLGALGEPTPMRMPNLVLPKKNKGWSKCNIHLTAQFT